MSTATAPHVPLPHELLSIGYLAQTVQIAPGRITARLDALGIRPVAVINGVPHYGADAVEALRREPDASPRVAIRRVPGKRCV